MMKLIFLIIIISVNCITMNCNEESVTESITTETVYEVSEKTDLFSADPELLESKTGSNESANEATNIAEDSEESRVSPMLSQSTTNRSPINETQFDLVSSETQNTQLTFTERSAPDDVVIETEVRTPDKEITRRDNSADTIQENLEPLEIVEKQSEQLSKTSTPTPETQVRKATDPLEASSESKISDNEKTSFIKDETARNSEIEEIREKSDKSDSIEGLETRRMLIPSDVIIDTKMRVDTTSSSLKPEMKTALNQNLNTYNLNEFATDRNIKLINSSRMESPPIIETRNQLVNNKLASQEIFNQQYIPKSYPRSELNINFPNVNSDFQGPRDLPIYLRIKSDEPQLQREARPIQWTANGLQPTPDEKHFKNQFIETQHPQLKSNEEYIYFNSRDKQLHHQNQMTMDSSRTDTNKHVEKRYPVPQSYKNNVTSDLKSFGQNNQPPGVNQNFGSQVQQSYLNSVPQLYQNHVPTDLKRFSQTTLSPALNQDTKYLTQNFNQNLVPTDINQKKQLLNINQESKNQVQPLYQNEKNTEVNYRPFENISRELKNQAHDNIEMPVNNNNIGNQYPLFRQRQGMTGMSINLRNEQFGNKPFADPYFYPQQPRPRQINVINTPSRYNIIPPNIKILFQKLASASLYPTQLATDLFGNNNRQIYPYLKNPNYRPNFSFYGFRY